MKNFDELRGLLASSQPRTLVVAAAHDEHTLEAVFSASRELPMSYKLVGNPEKILDISKSLGFSPEDKDIVPAGDNKDCAKKAVSLIRQGEGDVLMKGILETGTLLKAVLDRENGVRGNGTMSHLAVLEVPEYHKLIAVTDGGMIPYPDLNAKADIIRNASEFLQLLGTEKPKIAALSASEAVSEKIPESVDAAELKKLCEKGELGNCIVDGPLSFDLAISPEAAKIKGVDSPVSGDADILLAPSITAGNALCKGLLYWGGAKMAGCVLGAKVPIVLVSRGATAEEKLLSIMLCLGAGAVK